MRIESSIVTSLSELRAIEQQRIADERAASFDASKCLYDALDCIDGKPRKRK
jgi:hypothetical protein